MLEYSARMRHALTIEVPLLNRERVTTMLAERQRADINKLYQAQWSALRVARESGGSEAEALAVRSSEALRSAIWNIVLDCTQAEAWVVSMIAAQAGIGFATEGLTTPSYTVELQRRLTHPWTVGFTDIPYP